MTWPRALPDFWRQKHAGGVSQGRGGGGEVGAGEGSGWMASALQEAPRHEV